MNAIKPYLLDTNILIQAKNSYYAFAICPGFWKSMLGLHHSGQVHSIDQVRDELLRGKDELADWTRHKAPKSFFHDTGDQDVATAYRDIIAWVRNNPQYFELAKTDFAASADGWLIAFAKVNGYTVVTQEEHAPLVKNKVPIPNICIQFGVDFRDTFQMLKALKVRFDWEPRK